MPREVKLYYQNPEKNSNKVYIIREDFAGKTCTAWYGRLGFTLQSTTYPIEMFDKKVAEKLRKGYKEDTEGVL